MKRFLIAAALVFGLLPSTARAQAVIVPSPVPTCTNGDVLQWSSTSNNFVCTAASAISQPLTDALGLVRDGTDGTKVLRLEVSGITTSTTRVWTVPDANVTFPTTIASLGANTFSGTQTATFFSGDGSLLTALNATQLTSGTVPDARFPATLPVLSGVNLTALNASNLGSGTVASARIAGAYTGITQLGTVLFAAGNAGAPPVAIGEATSGWYLHGSGDVRLSILGTARHFFSSADHGIRSDSARIVMGSGDDVTIARGAARVVTFGPTTGVTLRWATVDTLEVRNFANSAYGALRASSLTTDTGGGVIDAGRGSIMFTGNGVLQLTDNTGSAFSRLLFGCATSSCPAIKRSGVELQARLANDSDYTTFVAGNIYTTTGVLYYNASGTIKDVAGNGSPEGVLTAGIGSTYRRLDGGAGTSFYVKESGTSNTGWVAK